MTYATTTDVAAKWRPLTPADEARVQAYLDEAEALLDALLPSLAANVATGTVNPVLARKVITDAVMRVMVNPNGVTQQTLGPESVQYAGVRQLGIVAFTDDELSLLTPAVVTDGGMVSADGWAIGCASIALPPHRRWGC